MVHHRADVVEQAIVVLDRYGLADLTMRRLGAELGVRPSALYHHVASKQVLLAAVADELLARGPHSERLAGGPEDWSGRVTLICTELREAMLAYRDGAELVATVSAFGLGADTPYAELLATLRAAGLPEPLARAGARTLLHFVFGHTVDEQTHLQAGSAGAVEGEPRESSDFALGLRIVTDGLRAVAHLGVDETGADLTTVEA